MLSHHSGMGRGEVGHYCFEMTWLGCEKQCLRFILITHSLKMLLQNNVILLPALYTQTQTWMSCKSADLYNIKMNRKIKTIVDRCLIWMVCYYYYCYSPSIPVRLTYLLFLQFSISSSPCLFSVVHPLRPQLTYLIKPWWGCDSVATCQSQRGLWLK